MSTTSIDAQTREAELKAIKQLVAKVEHAQNNELPAEFLSLFRPDAIWTTGAGKRLYGLEEITTFTHQSLPGSMQDLSVTFELEHILFIRPDVAAIKLRQTYQTPDGPDVGSPLWILSKENNQWQITASQNIGIPAEELPSKTGKRPIFAPTP